MARIRSIKPEIASDETLGRCSRDARLLFILLWTVADDWGRFRAAPEVLRGQLYPFDSDVTSELLDRWLNELEDAGRIFRYAVKSERYGVVTNWTRHQRVDNAGRPFYPSPPLAAVLGDSPSAAELAQDTDDSRGVRPSPSLAADLGDSPLDHWDHRDHSDHSGRFVSEESSAPDQGNGCRVPAADEGRRKNNRKRVIDQLARADHADAVGRGVVVERKFAFLKTMRDQREDTDGAAIDRLLDEHPEWSTEQIAEEILSGERPAPDANRPPDYEPDPSVNPAGAPVPPDAKAKLDAALRRAKPARLDEPAP